MYRPLAFNVWAAEEIKKVVGIPVIAGGGITSPDLAEAILKEGKAHFICLGRSLLADPYFPQKAQEGRPEDIRPCIRCMDGCHMRGVLVAAVGCSVNVGAVGRADEFKIVSTTAPKKVAVVGGGPAGMEAARVAALRGHDVTLFEKRKLGGRLIEASAPEFKADLRALIAYLTTQVKKTGIKVVNAEATYPTLRNGKFQAIVVATGGIPRVPEVRGIDRSSVVNALDVLAGAETGQNVIVVGAGHIGCDVSLFLAEQGKSVAVVEMANEIAQDWPSNSRLPLMERLSKQNAKICTGLILNEVTKDGIIAFDKSGQKCQIKGDTVVLATGLGPDHGLFDQLAKVPDLEVYAVGDCVEPRKIHDAIHEGYWSACRIA